MVSTNGQTVEHIVVGGKKVSNMATASTLVAKKKNPDSGSTVGALITSKMTKFKRSLKASSIIKGFSSTQIQLSRHNCSKGKLLIPLQAGKKVLKK